MEVATERLPSRRNTANTTGPPAPLRWRKMELKSDEGDNLLASHSSIASRQPPSIALVKSNASRRNSSLQRRRERIRRWEESKRSTGPNAREEGSAKLEGPLKRISDEQEKKLKRKLAPLPFDTKRAAAVNRRLFPFRMEASTPITPLRQVALNSSAFFRRRRSTSDITGEVGLQRDYLFFLSEFEKFSEELTDSRALQFLVNLSLFHSVSTSVSTSENISLVEAKEYSALMKRKNAVVCTLMSCLLQEAHFSAISGVVQLSLVSSNKRESRIGYIEHPASTVALKLVKSWKAPKIITPSRLTELICCLSSLQLDSEYQMILSLFWREFLLRVDEFDSQDFVRALFSFYCHDQDERIYAFFKDQQEKLMPHLERALFEETLPFEAFVVTYRIFCLEFDNRSFFDAIYSVVRKKCNTNVSLVSLVVFLQTTAVYFQFGIGHDDLPSRIVEALRERIAEFIDGDLITDVLWAANACGLKCRPFFRSMAKQLSSFLHVLTPSQCCSIAASFAFQAEMTRILALHPPKEKLRVPAAFFRMKNINVLLPCFLEQMIPASSDAAATRQFIPPHFCKNGSSTSEGANPLKSQERSKTGRISDLSSTTLNSFIDGDSASQDDPLKLDCFERIVLTNILEECCQNIKQVSLVDLELLVYCLQVLGIEEASLFTALNGKHQDCAKRWSNDKASLPFTLQLKKESAPFADYASVLSLHSNINDSASFNERYLTGNALHFRSLFCSLNKKHRRIIRAPFHVESPGKLSFDGQDKAEIALPSDSSSFRRVGDVQLMVWLAALDLCPDFFGLLFLFLSQKLSQGRDLGTLELSCFGLLNSLQRTSSKSDGKVISKALSILAGSSVEKDPPKEPKKCSNASPKWIFAALSLMHSIKLASIAKFLHFWIVYFLILPVVAYLLRA